MANENRKNQNLPVRTVDNELSRTLRGGGPDLEPYRYDQDLGGDYPESTAGGGFSLRDLFYVLFRHKLKIASIFVTVTFLAAAFVASQKDSFVSEAQISLAASVSDIMITPEGVEGARHNIVGNRVRKEIAVIRSRNVADAVIAQVGLERILTPPGDADAPTSGAKRLSYEEMNVVQKGLYGLKKGLKKIQSALNLKGPTIPQDEIAIAVLRENLEIKETMEGSNVLRMRFESHTPEVAQEVLAALVEACQVEHNKIHKLPGSREFYQKISQRLGKELTQKRVEFKRLEREHNIISLANQRELLYQQLSAFTPLFKQGNAQVRSLDERIKMLESMLVDSPENITSDGPLINVPLETPEETRIKDHLFALRLEEADLLSKFREDSTAVIEVRKKLETLTEMLSKIQKTPVENRIRTANPVRLGLEAQLRAAKTDRAAQLAMNQETDKDIVELNKQIAILSASEAVLVPLQTEIAQLEADHQQALTSLRALDDSAAANEARVSNLTVLQDATMPYGSAKSPRKLLAILFFGMLLGLATGIGLAFALEFINHTLKTNEDVEQWLGLPVLTALPKVRKHRPEAREVA